MEVIILCPGLCSWKTLVGKEEKAQHSPLFSCLGQDSAEPGEAESVVKLLQCCDVREEAEKEQGNTARSWSLRWHK